MTMGDPGSGDSPLPPATPLVNASNERADDQFLDDLSAAGRFKTFLVSRGRPVSAEVSEGIGRLLSAFSDDLKFFEHQTRIRNSWWEMLKARSSRAPPGRDNLPSP
jgi:hypothetical protein